MLPIGAHWRNHRRGFLGATPHQGDPPAVPRVTRVEQLFAGRGFHEDADAIGVEVEPESLDRAAGIRR